MEKLSREQLFPLEKYAQIRSDFRAKVMSHKRNRRLPVGPNATLYFEDRLTVHYQIQEMLRAERIFEAEGIQEELDAYNPLIPDGSNWKATFMVEFPDEEERRVQLARLVGIETAIWARVADMKPVTPVADEDLERSTGDKTSSVHFLRFELTSAMAEALKQGAPLAIGIAHPNYKYSCDPVPDNVRQSLVDDLS